MWTFATLLPLIIGDLVPETNPKWECFLLLLQITKFCTSVVVTPALSCTLKVLIEQHHDQFRYCYPDVNIIPKMHYMVHFPKQLLE